MSETRTTAALVFALGFVISLAGDATHVASGTTNYEWPDVPEILNSAVWFPFVVAIAVLAGAWLGERFAPPAVRVRERTDVVTAAGLVLGLYALTSVLRGEPTTVSVVLTAALAIAVWAWWDPSAGALGGALAAGILGPLGEIGIVELGAASYAPDADGLGGVAPWLPCLYFAVGAVTTRLWSTIRGDQR